MSPEDFKNSLIIINQITMRTFYFNSGVKSWNTDVEMHLRAGNKFVRNEAHHPYYVSDDIPEDAELHCITLRYIELYRNDERFIVAKLLGGNMGSGYAVFHKPNKS